MANPTFVQQSTSAQANGVTTASITLTGVTAGNTVVIGVQGFLSNTNLAFTAKDDLGNQYSPVTYKPQTVLSVTPYVFVLFNCPAGTRTITFNWGGASINFNGAVALEYSSAVGIGVSATPFGATTGTSATGNSLVTWGTNQLVMGFVTFHSGTATNAITVGSGFTSRSTITQNTGGYSFLMEEELQATAGTYSASASSTSAVSGSWVILTFTLIGATPGTLTNGTVVLGTSGGAGSIIGTAGGGNDPNSNPTTNALVFDANNWTQWYNPDASGDYVGIDCGSAISCDHVLFSFNNPSFANVFISPGTANIECTNDATWATFTTLFTFTNTTFAPGVIQWGALKNSLSLPLAGFYRYYRFTLPALASAPADLEFYGQYYSGVSATCAPVAITNPDGTTGGYFSSPIQVSMATVTSGTTILYTLDGTNPSSSPSAITYTGPFTVSKNTVVQACATLAGLSTSRVTLASYHINSIVPTDILYSVNRGGYRIWGTSGWRFLDPNPASAYFGKWLLYAMNRDSNGVLESTGSGIDTYVSSDLLNWSFVNNTSNIVESNPPGNRMAVVYNAANNNYVLWSQQALSANASVFTASTPVGPWTLAASYTSLDGYSTKGDHTLFQDTDGSCYLIIDDNGGPLPDTNSYTVIHKLNSAYTNTSGTFVVYNNNTTGNTTPFGRQSEGFAMFKLGNTYYWQSSNLSPWTPGQNLYVTNTQGPLGTWSSPINPFQPDPTELTDGAAGFWGPGPLTPSQNYAYDSQTVQFLLVPGLPGVNAGTPALIYFADRWDFRNFNVIQTTSDSFQAWRNIMLPVAVDPNTGALSIKWTDNWTFASAFTGILPVPAYGQGTPFISTLRIALLSIWAKWPYRLIQDQNGNLYTARQLINNQNQGTKALMQVMVQYDPVSGTIVWVTGGIRQTLLYTVTSQDASPFFTYL